MCVWQKEHPPDGTPHYQFYLELTSNVRRPALSRFVGLERAALYVCGGNRKQNVDYVTKDDTRIDGPWYFPNQQVCQQNTAQGRRNDLAGACELIQGGANNKRLAEEAPTTYVKYHKGLNKFREALQLEKIRDVETPLEVVYYVGPPGTGKTYLVMQECSDPDLWFWASPGKWFDGYAGQTGIVFNEFRDNWYTHGYLCKILDNAPMRVEVKGNSIAMNAHKFRFTSNIKPQNLYKGLKLDWDESNPLYRRLNNIVLMLERYVPPLAMQIARIDEAADWDDGFGDPEVPDGQSVWIDGVRVYNH